MKKMKTYKSKKVYHTKFKSDEGSKSIKDKTRRVFEYEGYCEEKTGRCHGTGKMTQVVIDNKTGKNITTPTKQEGEWINGSFWRGVYTVSPTIKHSGDFKLCGSDEELHGVGIELYYKNPNKTSVNDKTIGSVSGTFKEGTLIKGEVTNAFEIKYTQNKYIKHIHYESYKLSKKKPYEAIWKGKIFCKNGDLYEGEMSWDVPYGKGTYYTLATGGVKSGKWVNGEYQWT